MSEMDQAEQLKRLIVEPLIATVEEKLKNHVETVTAIVDGGMKRIDGLDGRVKQLEKDQQKAMMGWGVITLGVGTAITFAWNYLKGKIHIG